MQPYNALESQKLFRQVEHGQFRSLPGGELIDRLYAQLRVADELIAAMDQELKSGSARPRPDLSPVYLEFGRIIPSEQNPTGSGAPVTAVAPPVRLPAGTPIPAPAAGLPSMGGMSPFMGGARAEAPPPIPFNQTPEGLEAAAQNPPPAKRGRKSRLT